MLTFDGANALLKALTCNGTYAYNGAYVGLSTTPPNRDGTGVTEPSVDVGYRRTMIGRRATSASSVQTNSLMSEPEIGATTNNDIIFFSEATGNWGTCTHFLIFSAAEEGVLLAYGPLTNSIMPTANTVPIIRVGDLDMSIS